MRQKTQKYDFDRHKVRNLLTIDDNGVLYIERLSGKNKEKISLYPGDVYKIAKAAKVFDKRLNTSLAILTDKPIGEYKDIFKTKHLEGQERHFGVNISCGLHNNLFVHLSWNRQGHGFTRESDQIGNLLLKWREILLFYFNNKEKQ